MRHTPISNDMPSTNKLLLGIEIGGTKLILVAAESPTRILHRQRLTVERGADATVIRARLEQALHEWKHLTWRAAGVGFGGPVDFKTGRIACSHQVSGWNDIDLAAWLAEHVKAPVRVENDANLGALGEAVLGAGKGFSPVFYTNSGSGVGGGLIVNETIYHGAPPGEAELGHVRLAPGGPIVEDVCSGWAVDRQIREAIANAPDSALARLVRNEKVGEARHLSKALELGDPTAQRILEKTAGALGFALSHVVHLFHPSVIVLGGGLALLGDPWRTAIARALPQNLMNAFKPGPEVRLAALGEDMVPTGALILAQSLIEGTSRETS